MDQNYSDIVISTENLTKKFRDVLAVDGLELNVFRGDVFGFLGPNGAGKSTTIRMLVSLIFPTKGKVKIFGKSLKENRLEILRKVGAIVEKPDFYKNLTAYKNLEIFGKISGAEISKHKIGEVLSLVGLSERAKSKVKTYSHGMKQRLGIAQALLHDPELIILDEPTTGLDPQGMKDIRELILMLSSEKKKTILLSSHILYEVQLVANRMIIINKGKKVVEGNVSELLNRSTTDVEFAVSDVPKALEKLKELMPQLAVETQNVDKITLRINEKQISFLNKQLVESEIDVFSIIPKNSLEEYFLSLTEKETIADPH